MALFDGMRGGQTRRPSNDTRDRSRQMKEQLDAKSEKITELEQKIALQESLNKELTETLATHREEADQLVVGVTVQIQEMIDALNTQMEQMDVTTGRQIRQMGENSEKQLQQLSENSEKQLQQLNETSAGQLREIASNSDRQMEEMKDISNQQLSVMRKTAEVQTEKMEAQRTQLEDQSKQLEEMKQYVEQITELRDSAQALCDQLEETRAELVDKVHSENVKCYRNVKALLSEMTEQPMVANVSDKSLEAIRQSVRGVRVLAFFSVLSFAAVIFLILYFMGILKLF